MRRASLLLLLGALLCAGSLWGQQAKVTPAKAMARPATGRSAQEEPVSAHVDGDQAYKANCSRCHMSPRKFSARKMVTIMRHMRVRGNLTEDETEAILKYLTR